MSQERQRALVIEDDDIAASLVEVQLNDLGFTMERAVDGRSGLEKALAQDYGLAVVDLGLPKLGGLEVCRQLREAKPRQAILILTGEQDELKAVLALELGADEYIRKPFSAMELRARIRALLRRAATGAAETSNSSATLAAATSERLAAGAVSVDLELCHVYYEQTRVLLSPTEYDLLVFLMKNANRTFSRQQLVEALWNNSVSAYELNVRSHISRLRNKLKEAGATAEYITTEHGFGYRFQLP